MTDQPQLPPQQPQGGYPQPSISPEQERNLGMIAHLVPAILLPLSAGTAGFVASLVVYLVYKDRGPFVRAHAANSLNVQIITGILIVVSYALTVVLIGFVTLGIVILVAMIIHIVGAVKASNGQWWEPPMTPKMVK